MEKQNKYENKHEQTMKVWDVLTKMQGLGQTSNFS